MKISDAAGRRLASLCIGIVGALALVLHPGDAASELTPGVLPPQKSLGVRVVNLKAGKDGEFRQSKEGRGESDLGALPTDHQDAGR